MLTALPFSLYHESGDAMAILYSSLIVIGLGAGFYFLTKNMEGKVGKREGYLIVATGWLSMVFAGTLPYLLSGVIPDLTNAFFEVMSGMTTTGASILTDIEATPKGILYWRSMTQWIGGMGIIVLTVAIMPLLGIGGVELFAAEAPGPKSDKIHPRIRETAKRLWLIYVSLTAILAVILWAVGMTTFDAINHAFTTMATGGFSTKNASMAAFDTPWIHYPIIFFMFLAGTNYTIIYLSLKGKWKQIWKSDEFKTYAFLVIGLTLLITFKVVYYTDMGMEKSFRESLFSVVSLITTTGFVSIDYTQWSNGLTMIFFILLFTGASAGSTSGGIKIIRHLVFVKNSTLEFKRLLHPKAILPLKLNGQVVPPKIMTHIFIFLLLYMALVVLGTVLLSIFGLDFQTALGATATSLGNVGPGIGDVGPVDNFAWLPSEVKWVLCFLMLLGRLELFTILILFTGYFWK